MDGTYSNILTTLTGLLAQGFFSARILVQWYKSEKEGTVKSPVTYWVFSLAGSYIMLVYGLLRHDFPIILGQIITFYIYIWNLEIKGVWGKLRRTIKIAIAVTPAVILLIALGNAGEFSRSFMHDMGLRPWLVIFGSTAQIVFTLRFIYQIIYSSRRHVSSLPSGFWVLSLVGSGMIIIYAIFRKDIVLILGQAFGFLAYIRNLMLCFRPGGKVPEATTEESDNLCIGPGSHT